MSLLIETSQTSVGEFNWKQRLAAEMNDVSRWSAEVGPAIVEFSEFKKLCISITWTPSLASYLWLREHCEGDHPIKLIRKYGGWGCRGPHCLPLCPAEYEWDDNAHQIRLTTYITCISFSSIMEESNIILPQLLGVVLTVAILPYRPEFPPIMPASDEWRESHTNESIDPYTGKTCFSIPAGGGSLLYRYRVRMRLAPTDVSSAFEEPTISTVTILPDKYCGYWTCHQDFRQWHNHIYDSQQ